MGYVEPKPYAENPLVRAQYEREPLKPIELDPNPDSVSIPVCAPAPDPSDETTALTGRYRFGWTVSITVVNSGWIRDKE